MTGEEEILAYSLCPPEGESTELEAEEIRRSNNAGPVEMGFCIAGRDGIGGISELDNERLGF